MAVSEEDVRHVATLARLGIGPERMGALVTELNGILAHMDAIGQVDVTGVEPSASGGSAAMPLRSDSSSPVPLERPVGSFAPEQRDGFFLVPRLATHGDSADAEAEGGA